MFKVKIKEVTHKWMNNENHVEMSNVEGRKSNVEETMMSWMLPEENISGRRE